MNQILCCDWPPERAISCPLGSIRRVLQETFSQKPPSVKMTAYWSDQGLGKGYQLQPSASADNPTSTLMILDTTKTSSNN